uniref:ATP synthase CF1 delta subunit n=1 Tax=Glaucosphaera vacuolata TaxID=38265 RepID=UPI001FCD30F0|nr:ATP synthase CF1 delta subunit [Glaucosphaera vacuolata]UNJ18663.1 ATP synthase CF1 delta subunit [Glaucosphaera vacuolata]
MSNKNTATKIAQPYAEALIEIVKKSQSLDMVNKDMSLIADVLSSSNQLEAFLSNPLILNKEKKNILNELFNDKISSLSLRFLMLLVDRKRISLVKIILSKYLELAYKVASITVIKVTTAVLFTEGQIEALTTKLKLMTKSDQLKLDIEVDPELIAGFTIQIDSKVIDTSLKGQLYAFASHMNI